MPNETIRYFGTDVVYGEDCQPLSEHQRVVVTDARGPWTSMPVGDMTCAKDDWEAPVSFEVLPF